MMQPKYFQKEWIGFQVRRIHLRRSTSRREKPLRSQRNRFSKFNLKMREKMLFSMRSMKILKSSKENSLRIWSLTIRNLLNKMRSLTKHSQKVSLVSEKKLSNGRSSTLKLKGCFQIFKQNSKRIRLFGLESLTFWRSKRSNTKRTMRISKLFSNRLLTNSSVIAKIPR